MTAWDRSAAGEYAYLHGDREPAEYRRPLPGMLRRAWALLDAAAAKQKAEREASCDR